MKALLHTLAFLAIMSSVAAEEPAIEALLKDSPLIVVADPVFEKDRPPIGIGSEVVLVKYGIKFKVKRILKSDSTSAVKVDDTIFTRLALFLERPQEETFNPEPGRLMILFLRPTSYEKGSFENTSTWFGVMNNTERRERMLAYAIKEASASATKR